MPLTRKFLTALGIEPDKVDEIINQHVEVTESLKADLNKYKTEAEKLPTVQKELSELKAQMEKHKGEDYEALKQQFENYKNQVAKENTQRAKEKAYRALLADANLSDKGIEKAIKYASWDKIELEEDGKVKDAKEHIKAAKDEWAEYVVQSGAKGAETKNPPSGGGEGAEPNRAIAAANRFYNTIYGEVKEGDKK